VTSIQVAVIVRPGASVERCLAALQATGAPAPAVVPLKTPGGYAEARNSALAACTADVIALVEDDVTVEPDWLDALTAAWSHDSARDLAITGGPLRPAFPDGRPPWLGDGLLSVFALHELGSEERDVDPSQDTFHAGNVAFRAAALRGVGGFWPSRGHPDARDWFSEIHHAQRELAQAGWRSRYLPGAEAHRIVPGDIRRRDVLRKRLRYGARLSLVGEPAPPAWRERRPPRSRATRRKRWSAPPAPPRTPACWPRA
jgi:cellulose synthase/poly-beta-1,6-N-acetylglucosamine synthase-like glycosyltransferase